ncbi:MAG TPA: lipopolysaccharide biosynthesis protein [Pyrinomonadaceae bacterium]|nr:lipopolysaccharide biosynthesis protein [Pyrinomonadaceae bacterium]
MAQAVTTKERAAEAAGDGGGEARPASMTHRSMSGMFWLLSGSGVQAVLRVAVIVVMARLLGPADFGLVAGALVLVDFVEVFSDLGIGLVIVQRHELEERHIRTGFTLSALLGLVFGAGLWLAAPAASQLMRMDGLTPVLRAMAVVFPVDSLSLVASALLQRDLQFRTLARISVAAYVVGYGAVGVSLALAGLGVWALVWAYVAQQLFVSVALLAVRPHPKRLHFDPRSLREMTYTGAGFSAAQIFNYVALKGDNAVIGRWLGAGALGVYTRAYGLMTMSVTIFGSAFDRVMFASLAKMQHERERLALAFRRGVALITLIILPTSAVMFVLAPEVIQVLLGPKWSEVVVPFQVLAVGMLFRTSYKVSASVARATGAVYRSAWRQGAYAVFVVAGAWAGQFWGVVGVSLGVLVALAVFFALMAQLSVRLTSITWRDYLAAHAPAASLTLLVGFEVWGAAALLRSFGAPAFAVLAASAGVALLTFAALLRLWPRLALGEDGLWALCRIVERLPERFRPAARWRENLERALTSA